jgi:hypothetical protein
MNLIKRKKSIIYINFQTIVGEIEAARAKNVHLYVAQKIEARSKKKKSTQSQNKRTGLLIITNFRLSFVVFDEKNDKNNKVCLLIN